MRSNVRIGNHPVHPILVLVPVGLWIGALVFDIIFLSTGNPFWFQAAYWNILFGIVGALVAALAGSFDLFTLNMSDAARRTGITHLILNVSIIVLYIINLAIRGGATPATAAAAMTPFVLNLVSVVMLLISGWLGGQMIYKHGVAVPDEAADEALRYSRQAHLGATGTAGALGGESEFPPEER